MSATGHRLLVVDDDRAIRDLVKRLAARYGFVIDAANDGTEAWTLIAEKIYDAVLLDLMMPNMNGFDLVDRIRQERPSLLPRIVIMTAFSRGGKMPVVEGVHSMLRKPFDIGELLEHINDAALEREHHDE